MQEHAGREAVLAEIVDRELAMFLTTNNEGGVSICQTRPDTFRAMRLMAHAAHEDAVLVSILTICVRQRPTAAILWSKNTPAWTTVCLL